MFTHWSLFACQKQSKYHFYYHLEHGIGKQRLLPIKWVNKMMKTQCSIECAYCTHGQYMYTSIMMTLINERGKYSEEYARNIKIHLTTCTASDPSLKLEHWITLHFGIIIKYPNSLYIFKNSIHFLSKIEVNGS